MKRLALVVLLVVAGCGQASDDPSASTVVHGVGTVLEDESHGPELCFAVQESYPPQCTGVQLQGFDWPDDVEHASGTLFGEYGIEGRLVDGVLSVDRVVRAADVDAEPEPDTADAFATPCAEPSGGWRPEDATRTTEATLERFFETAETLPGYAEAWIDDQGAPLRDDTQDPMTTILNVRVTEDVEGAERALRAVWGGSMCVTEATYTQDELLAIQDEITSGPDVVTADSGRDVVNLTVIHDDGTLQKELDATYGAGRVVVSSALRPGPLPD